MAQKSEQLTGYWSLPPPTYVVHDQPCRPIIFTIDNATDRHLSSWYGELIIKRVPTYTGKPRDVTYKATKIAWDRDVGVSNQSRHGDPLNCRLHFVFEGVAFPSQFLSGTQPAVMIRAGEKRFFTIVKKVEFQGWYEKLAMVINPDSLLANQWNILGSMAIDNDSTKHNPLLCEILEWLRNKR